MKNLKNHKLLDNRQQGGVYSVLDRKVEEAEQKMYLFKPLEENLPVLY
jgi:hypothetical protein